MILPVAFILGALVGWRRATKLQGTRSDQLQFAAAFGIAFSLVALVGIVLAGALGFY